MLEDIKRSGVSTHCLVCPTLVSDQKNTTGKIKTVLTKKNQHAQKSLQKLHVFQLLTLLGIIIDFYSKSKFVTTFTRINIYHTDTLKLNMRVTLCNFSFRFTDILTFV